MSVIDLHCDTIYKLFNYPNLSEDDLYKNNLSIDIKRLKQADYLCQCFALFLDLKETATPFKTCSDMLKLYKKSLEKNSQYISSALNYDDILKNKKENKISSILTIEEGGALEGKLSNLDYFYKNGVRLITLTWNYPNEIGFPNYDFKYKDKGLTSFGFEALEKMNELNMIIDVSHLSDQGFLDVYENSKKPFVATHSNSRFITNHPRNLTDDMIKKISTSGGVMGINFEKSFLGKSSKGRLEEMLSHIKHIKNVGGIDVISIGSDFDGIETASEINNCSEMYKLADILKINNFTENDIEKILYKNALRVIKNTL